LAVDVLNVETKSLYFIAWLQAGMENLAGISEPQVLPNEQRDQ